MGAAMEDAPPARSGGVLGALRSAVRAPDLQTDEGRSASRLELFFEAKNLFNTTNIAGVNRAIATDAFGNPASPILFDASAYPDAGKSGYDQRVMQLGAKIVF